MPDPTRLDATTYNLRGSKAPRTPLKEAKAARPVVNIPPLKVVPPLPRYLQHPEDREEWAALAPLLVEQQLLTRANLNLFGMLCATFGKLARSLSPPDPEKEKKRIAAKKPARKTKVDISIIDVQLLMQYRVMCVEFGLTPMSAAKARAIGDLGPTGKTPPTNEFARNRRGARTAAAPQEPLQ